MADGRPHPRLSVLHVTHSGEPGGAELALLRLVQAPSWHAVVTTPRSPGPSVFDAVARYERIGPRQPAGASSPSPVDSVRFASRVAAAAISLRRSEAFRRADLLHANTARSAVYATLAGVGTGMPVVVHINDMVDSEGMGRIGAEVMHRFVLPRAAGVIACSKAALTSAKQSVGEGVLTTAILPPSDLQRPEKVKVRSQVRQVGMVARLHSWKGQMLLLHAFARAFPTGDVVLRFAGGAFFESGGFETDLRREVEAMGLGDRVSVEGHLDDIPSFLDEIDIAVHCAMRPEPLGQNVVQYLAAGKATIVSGEGGPLEWVKDRENGLTFEPRSVVDLAAKLRSLAADRELRSRLAHSAVRTPGLLTDDESRASHGRFFRKVYENHRRDALLVSSGT